MIVIVVFVDTLPSNLSATLIDIVASLTGLPSSAFHVSFVTTESAGTVATVVILGSDASRAASSIVSTLSSDSEYFHERNSMFPNVASARVAAVAAVLGPFVLLSSALLLLSFLF